MTIGGLRSTIVRLRDWYLVWIRWHRYEIGRGFHAGRAVAMWAKHGIRIGQNCYIGRGSQIECDANIGHNVIIANSVGLVGRYDHDTTFVGVPVRKAPSIRDGNYDGPGLSSKVVIEDDVWIGYGAVVLSGVRIGEGSVVAAGAVVVKDVPPYSVVAGNPARVVSARFKIPDEVVRHRQALEEFRKREGCTYEPADHDQAT